MCVCVCVCVCAALNFLVARVFVSDQGDRVSIPSRVILVTQKMVPHASLLNTQHYKVRIKSKWSNPSKRIAPSPTPQYSRL